MRPSPLYMRDFLILLSKRNPLSIMENYDLRVLSVPSNPSCTLDKVDHAKRRAHKYHQLHAVVIDALCKGGRAYNLAPAPPFLPFFHCFEPDLTIFDPPMDKVRLLEHQH